MNRELLIELGVEELPASWLPPLTRQLAEVTARQLDAQRLAMDAPPDAYSTPRRLAVRVAGIAERQRDSEELLTGPPVSAATGPDGRPTPAASGFAKKHGVAVGDLEHVQTPKGSYLAYRNRLRGKSAVDDWNVDLPVVDGSASGHVTTADSSGHYGAVHSGIPSP